MKMGNLTTIVQLCLGLGKGKSEKVDMGTKLLEVKASMIEDKNIRSILYLFFVLFLTYVGFTIFTWFQGRNVETWQFITLLWMPLFIFLFTIKRTYGIYENGIKIMTTFYPWNTFKDYIAKNGQVAIYYKSFFSGRFVLPDDNGNIEEIIMKYLEPNPKMGLLD